MDDQTYSQHRGLDESRALYYLTHFLQGTGSSMHIWPGCTRHAPSRTPRRTTPSSSSSHARGGRKIERDWRFDTGQHSRDDAVLKRPLVQGCFVHQERIEYQAPGGEPTIARGAIPK